MMSNIVRIAVIVSHPIQHFCPMYASWAQHNDFQLKVFFASSIGVQPYHDPGFGTLVNWNNLYLDSFDHVFLNEGKSLSVNSSLDAPDLTNELSTYNPAVIIIYGYNQIIQKKAMVWGKRNNKKVFYISDSERAHDESSFRWFIKKQLRKSFFKKVDCCLTVGNFNEHYYHWMGVSMDRMIRLGFSIDLPIYQKAYEKRALFRKEIREKYNVPESSILISMVGKLIKRKRQIDIVRSLKILEDSSLKHFTLLVVGMGEDEQKIINEASTLSRNLVIITGFIPAEKLVAYYAATDIYVHASEYDPHTLAVSEAIYMGCPVIVSNKCGVFGPNDDVQVGKNGYTYECGNVTMLSRLLNHLGKSTSLLNEFSANSHIIGQENQIRAHSTGLITALMKEELL